MASAGRGRRRAGRREPPPGPRGEAGGHANAFHLGLHRQPPEPQGEADPAAGSLDPFGRHRLGALEASAPRRPRDGGPGRGQPRRRAGEGRSGACRARRVHRPLPRPGGRPDDHGAVVEDPEASRPHFARLAELAVEHGLARLSMGTSQDWEVAAQEGATSSGSAAASTLAAGRCPGIMGVKEYRERKRTPQRYGPTRHMAARARVLRPRRGPRLPRARHLRQPHGSHGQETLAPRGSATVSRISERRRARDEIDDIFAEDERPRRGRVLQPVGNGADVQVHLVTPHSFNDAQG